MRSDDKVSFIRLSKYTRLWLPAWYQVHIYSPLGVIFSPSIRLPSSMRSEEHTSELQSRPHISYAVFCLKKKKKK